MRLPDRGMPGDCVPRNIDKAIQDKRLVLELRWPSKLNGVNHTRDRLDRTGSNIITYRRGEHLGFTARPLLVAACDNRNEDNNICYGEPPW